MLNPQQRKYLDDLAKAYKAYMNESLPIEDKDKGWFSHSQRDAIHTELGTYLIYDCYYNGAFMRDILNILKDALCDSDELITTQAKQVCIMFEELYKKDLVIADSIKAAWDKSPLNIDQLDKGINLSVILASSMAFPPRQPLVFTFEKANQEEKASKQRSVKETILNFLGL